MRHLPERLNGRVWVEKATLQGYSSTTGLVHGLLNRGEWGYLDRFLFFLCRPFPNYPICEINVLLYFSHFFLSPVFFILF